MCMRDCAIRAIPTSERSAAQAREGGIPLTSFTEHRRLDLTIDGADEIEIGSLNLIKGAGGALLREKIVAAASERLVIVADGRKLVERLGATVPVPVEVVPFGWETTADRLRRLGTDPQPRRDQAGQLFCTDGGNRILDCRFGAISDPAGLDRQSFRSWVSWRPGYSSAWRAKLWWREIEASTNSGARD